MKIASTLIIVLLMTSQVLSMWEPPSEEDKGESNNRQTRSNRNKRKSRSRSKGKGKEKIEKKEEKTEKKMMPIVLAPGLGSSCEHEIEKESGSIFILKHALELLEIKEYQIYCLEYNTNFKANINDILNYIEKYMDTKVDEWGLRDGFIGIGLS